LIKVTC